MRYYVYKDGDQVVGYNQTNRILPPPAIEVTKEEFISLGYYIEPSVEEPQPEPRPEPSVWDEMAEAYQKGVQEA